MNDHVIEMLRITKDFPGIRANDDVTLRLRRGEIHALLGENGAGKSTLMSVLFGMYQPDSGTILKNGREVKINDPNDANALGIGMVHQHFKLVHNFSVLDNIVLGVETTKRGVLQMKDARERVKRLSAQYSLMVDPDALISDITVGMQQRVEILKMLYRENEILIFDEPTAVLTPQEIEELMKIMRALASEGKSILFITHKLNEIKAVADRCTVLRKGKLVATVDVADVTREQMSEMMVGRKVSFAVEKSPSNPGKRLLALENVTVEGRNRKKAVVNDVSFDIRAGEIVCVAGIDGNGQSELVQAITGLMSVQSGAIFLGNRDITRASIRDRNDWGIAHIPEDRQRDGLVLDYTLADNLVLKSYMLPQYQNRRFIRFAAVDEHANLLIKKFDIRASRGAETIARSMSGGNQQKAIVAREIAVAPEVLVAVQPTRGLDVGAIEFIHKQLISERDKGKGILLVSFELDEVLNVSDRILVMYEGEIVARLEAKDATVEQLGLFMSGSRREAR